MPIPVSCSCGKKFAAKDELAGKRVKCPACGGVIAIGNLPATSATRQPASAPQPAPGQAADPLFANDPFAGSAGGGGFDLGNLAQFESAPAPPLGTGQGSSLGSAAAARPVPGGFANGPAMAGNWGAAQNPQRAAKPAASKGLSLGLILGLAGGGVALLVIMVAVVCVFAFVGFSGSQVAQNPTGPAGSSPPGSASPGGASPGGASPSGPGGMTPGGGAPGGAAPGGGAPGGMSPGGGAPGAGGPGAGAPGGLTPGGGAPGGLTPGGAPGGLTPGGAPGGLTPGGAPGGLTPGGGAPGGLTPGGLTPGGAPGGLTPGGAPGGLTSGGAPGGIRPGGNSPKKGTQGSSTPVDSGKPLRGAALAWHGKPGSTFVGARPIKGGDELVVYQYSWMCELLPHLGYEKLYNDLNFKEEWTRDPNLTVARTVIPQFLNPTDNRHRWKGHHFPACALAHFTGISGIEDSRNVLAAELPRTDPRAGVFGYKAIARPNEIADGTSNTLMLIGSGELAGLWIQGGGATVRGAREPYFDKISGFGSKGAKPGAIAMFADGSVRRIPADIDPKVFRALCTIRGGESVDLAPLGPSSTDISAK